MIIATLEFRICSGANWTTNIFSKASDSLVLTTPTKISQEIKAIFAERDHGSPWINPKQACQMWFFHTPSLLHPREQTAGWSERISKKGFFGVNQPFVFDCVPFTRECAACIALAILSPAWTSHPLNKIFFRGPIWMEMQLSQGKVAFQPPWYWPNHPRCGKLSSIFLNYWWSSDASDIWRTTSNVHPRDYTIPDTGLVQMLFPLQMGEFLFGSMFILQGVWNQKNGICSIWTGYLDFWTINNARIEPLVGWVYEKKDPLITFRVHSLSKTKGGIQINIIETIK